MAVSSPWTDAFLTNENSWEEVEISNSYPVFQETLELLEWPKICECISSFASTNEGRRLARNLSFPATMKGSEELLAEATAALTIESLLGGALDFQGVNTSLVKEAIGMMRKGMVAGGPQVAAVAVLIMAANGLQKAVIGASNAGSLEDGVNLVPLIELVKPLAGLHEVVRAITDVVEEDGSVRENSSSELRQACVQHRTLKSRLEELLSKLARDQGGEIAVLGERMCLVLPADGRANVQGLVLQSEGAGRTFHMEPTAAVMLNNKLAEVRTEIDRAERAVLSALCLKIRDSLDDIKFSLDVVVHLDVIVARARYSSWIGGTRPIFSNNSSSFSQTHSRKNGKRIENKSDVNDEVDGEDELEKGLMVDLIKARHPLLLQQWRENIRKAKLKATAKAKALARTRTRPGAVASGLLEEAEKRASEALSELAALEASIPVPIDLRIRWSTRVVTITGPNTGGKTASIKTMALAALMAKAGLYVLATDAVIPWFDSVLADIGDQQSLSQSLSTFSGHLTRIQRIKEASTADSLVLLDEVGAGTDPTEGAALGMALLESFSERKNGGSLLTFATTHHGELKTLKYRDPCFENASVEFDEIRLAPTYRLLWGIPGRSNALNIAERLGLPADVISHAREIQGSSSAEVNEVIMEMEQARKGYEDDVITLEKLIFETEKMYSNILSSSVRLQRHRARLLAAQTDIISAAGKDANIQIINILRNSRINNRKEEEEQFGGGSQVSFENPEKGGKMEGQNSFVRGSQEKKTGNDNFNESSMSENANGKENRNGNGQNWIPKEGEVVVVPKLGSQGKVTSVNLGRKSVTLQLGIMPITLKLEEVSRLDQGPIRTGNPSPKIIGSKY